ncbi:hypothetical protein [uncultured Prevotella sp.]|uniref:hypothetical protein n=1 Tax=uncultured Prevotella sp. TaxID=159272 RepID=UPI0027E2DE25|nr:hypothetical protein [uncultured Prevotella sp.]
MIWIIVIIVIVLFLIAVYADVSKASELDERYGPLTKTYTIGTFLDSSIRIYEESHKVWIMGEIYDFKDILSVTLETETKKGQSRIIATTSTDTLGTIGRSMVGKLAGGNTGALIGAGTAKKKTVIEQETIEDSHVVYILDIKIDNLQRPVISIKLEDNRDQAIELYSVFDLIIKRGN